MKKVSKGHGKCRKESLEFTAINFEKININIYRYLQSCHFYASEIGKQRKIQTNKKPLKLSKK